MTTAAEWKTDADAWLIERGITPGAGEAVEAKTVLLAARDDVCTTTRAILSAERPTAALWQPTSEADRAALSILTSRGWTVLAYFDASAIESLRNEDSDNGEIDDKLRTLGRTLATQPIIDFIESCDPPKHPTDAQLRTYVKRRVAQEHPEHADDIATFCETYHFNYLVGGLNNIRAVHQRYWLEHGEDLADRVLEWKPDLTGTTKKALRPVVWSYLQSIDRCGNQDVCDPAVEVLQERLKSRQA